MKNLSDHIRSRISGDIKSFLFKSASYFFMLGGLSYLTYKFLHFNDYQTFINIWKDISGDRIYWLILVILLLPVNLLLESIKWRKTIEKLEKINLKKSMAAVLTGMSTGFITPNKVGDIWGRIHWMKPENREKGVGYLAINSLTQNIAIILLGLPSALLFFGFMNKSSNQNQMLMYFVVILFLLLALYYNLISIIKKSKAGWITKYGEGIKRIAPPDLHQILGWAILRFLVFIVQFYALLHFWGIPLSPLQATMTIPAYYLFITFTPSIALSDAIIRSTYAVMFLGAVMNQPILLSVAGVSLWIINVVIPVITGTLLMIGNNLMKK